MNQKTVMYGVLGIAAIYVVYKLIPEFQFDIKAEK